MYYMPEIDVIQNRCTSLRVGDAFYSNLLKPVLFNIAIITALTALAI